MAGARSFGPAYLKRTFRFNATRKGLLGGSRFWLAMFGFLQVAKWSGKVTKRGDAPVKFSESLQAGESFIVRHVDAKTAKAEATGGAGKA
ncbi:MAG: hypothetical protein AAGA90_08100 [Actinomycetota bacterium]